MARRRFAPDCFTLGLFGLGLLMLVVPDLRVAGLIATILAMCSWVITLALRWTYRSKGE